MIAANASSTVTLRPKTSGTAINLGSADRGGCRVGPHHGWHSRYRERGQRRDHGERRHGKDFPSPVTGMGTESMMSARSARTRFYLDTDDNFSGSELTVDFPAFDFGGLKPQPVAHDWDQDGDDDNGDGSLTSNDALIVINALNKQAAAGGEGESSATFVTVSPTSTDPSAAASQAAAPDTYFGAILNSMSDNRGFFPMNDAAAEDKSSELTAAALLAIAEVTRDNDCPHAARDLVLADPTQELTETDVATDSLAADLVEFGPGSVRAPLG